MLGDYEVLILDEAHELTDYATTVWGVTLREHTLISLAEEATNFFGKIGSKDAREFARQSDAYTALISLWTQLEVGRLRYTDIIELGDELVRDQLGARGHEEPRAGAGSAHRQRRA